MAGPASKRKQRRRDKESLKHKAIQPLRAPDISDTLLDETLRDRGVENQVVVRSPAKAANENKLTGSKLRKASSKEEARKLRQLESKQRISAALQNLKASSLSKEARRILTPSSKRGSKLTAREQLRLDKVLAESGLPLSVNSRLFKTVEDVSSDDMFPTVPNPRRNDLHAPKTLPSTGGAASEAPVGAVDDTGSEDDLQKSTLPAPSRNLSGRAAPDAPGFGPACQRHPPSADVSVPPVRCSSELQAQARRHRDRMIAEGHIAGPAADLPKPADGTISVPGTGMASVRLIERDPGMTAARSNLPILGLEQEIMALIDTNDVVLLCGSTGCGKTTQLPQFLFEAGFGPGGAAGREGLIGVTQPRRVAAVSTARRVAEELGEVAGGAVGYQVRHDRTTGPGTAIKFMTDGILMRELQDDFLLLRYSVIIIDEAHERSLNTDLLLGLLSRIVPQRRAMARSAVPAATSSDAIAPLKVVIMSATLQMDALVENRRLFPESLYPHGPPPVIDVPARQYPVTVHFSRRTEQCDYLGAAYRKVCRIHKELPAGGILVFLTGQREVRHLCARLAAAFAGSRDKGARKLAHADVLGLANGSRGGGEGALDDLAGADLMEAGVEAFEAEDGPLDWEGGSESSSSSEGDPGEEEDPQPLLGASELTGEDLAAAERFFEARYGLGDPGAGSGTHVGADEAAPRTESQPKGPAPVHVLPLYALLTQDEQAKVFAEPPAGHRLIVVATNVAETSLTIPGIRYVVDAGRAKSKILDPATGVHHFDVRWISQASAQQRAGRAGRTAPGHCYRLYSSAVFNDLFPLHTAPEIANTALEGVVLFMHALGLPKVVNFPFPSSPPVDALQNAERCLVALSALRPGSAVRARGGSTGAELTPVGRVMSLLPLAPRPSCMLLKAVGLAAAPGVGTDEWAWKAIPHAVALSAAMSVEAPFLHEDALAPAASADDDAAARQARVESRNKVHAAQTHLRCKDSDALSALLALLAFEAEPPGGRSSFCKQRWLHENHLREMAALHSQLTRLLRQPGLAKAAFKAALPGAAVLARLADSGALAAGSVPARPGSRVQEKLRQCIAAGWADQIAHRTRSAEYLQQQSTQGKGFRAVRYQPCASEDTVYLHPRSCLHKRAPEYVAYLALAQTEKRTYVSGVTRVEPQWLCSAAAAELSEPLATPAPAYSRTMDAVVAWHSATYGMHAWPLPLHPAKHPSAEERCAVFASALLSGDLVPALSPILQHLNIQAGAVARREARALARVSDLLRAMQARGIDSCASLRSAWQEDGEFLKQQLLQLVEPPFRATSSSLWHTMLVEAFPTPQHPGLQKRKGAHEGKDLKSRNAKKGKSSSSARGVRL